MNVRVLFVASCVALITSAFTFIIRGDILPDLVREFSLSQTQGGLILSGAFWGMAFSMLLGAPLCDVLGMKRILLIAWVCHMVGVMGTILAPHNDWSFTVLFAATFVAGCGNGLVEIAINPLAATLFPKEKTHYLNVLHAWWPGGLVLGGLIASGIGHGFDLGFVDIAGMGFGWQARMALIFVPGIIYLLMFIPQRFPETERVTMGVTTSLAHGRAVCRASFLLVRRVISAPKWRYSPDAAARGTAPDTAASARPPWAGR